MVIIGEWFPLGAPESAPSYWVIDQLSYLIIDQESCVPPTFFVAFSTAKRHTPVSYYSNYEHITFDNQEAQSQMQQIINSNYWLT